MTNLPTNTPQKLLTKKRLPISIRFALRPGYNTIQIRISVDGEEGSPFSTLPGNTVLYATGVHWNQSLQRATGRAEIDRTFNLEIDSIRAGINAAYDRQITSGFVPTVTSVKQEYQTGKHFTGLDVVKESQWSALHCYRTYLTELETGGFPEKKLVKTTLAKWRYGLTYLETYVEQTREQDSLSSGPADELTLFWGKSYHRWLMKQGMAADGATRYVNRLIEAISHTAESGVIKQNPLATLKLPRDKTKDVHFLEPHHLERFWQLDNRGKGGDCIWWMGVIMSTGLDHPDAVRYVQNRDAYEQDTPWGKQIVINRSKPPQSECYIPVLPELEALLQRMPNGNPPTAEQINDYMKGVEVLIGFPHRLTCKVGRKTAGAIFFSEYEDIGAVSKILGHSSITITERYYVKTTAHTVNKAMQKRYVSPSTYQPFRRSA